MKKRSVSIQKLRVALRDAGITVAGQAEIFGHIKNNISAPKIRIARPIAKRICTLLARDGKVGLFLAGRGKVYIVKSANVEFKNWEAGRVALRKYFQRHA